MASWHPPSRIYPGHDAYSCYSSIRYRSLPYGLKKILYVALLRYYITFSSKPSRPLKRSVHYILVPSTSSRVKVTRKDHPFHWVIFRSEYSCRYLRGAPIGISTGHGGREARTMRRRLELYSSDRRGPQFRIIIVAQVLPSLGGRIMWVTPPLAAEQSLHFLVGNTLQMITQLTQV